MSEDRATARASGGVYYSRTDYAGFWRRVVVDLVDFGLVFLLVVIVTGILRVLVPGGEAIRRDILFWTGLASSFLYFVVLRRSSFGTIGYRVGDVRIVNLPGDRPSIWVLTMRLPFMLFIVLGPLNMLVDILWLIDDRHRQALRDKFVHTYVVRRQAVPAGHGAIGYANYTIMGLAFLFAEVREAKTHDP